MLTTQLLTPSPLALLLFTLFISTSSSLDYGPAHTPNCQALDIIIQHKDFDLLWNIFILHGIDKYFYVILCPIILIVQLLILLTFHRNESLLIRSGNVFRGLIFIESILNLQLFINSIYHFIFSDYQPMPQSFPPFCNSMSVIFVFFQASHFSYLLMFLIYTIVNFRFSLRKRPDRSLWITLNIVVLLVSAGTTILLYLLNLTGLSYYGICQVTLAQQPTWNSIMPWISIGIAFMYTIIGLFTLIYFRKHIPKSSAFEKRKNSQNRTISMIVIGFSFFLILLSTFELILDLNCLSNTTNSSLDVLVTFSNLARLLQYVFLIIIILRNSIFRSRLKNTIKKILQSNDRPFVADQYIQYGLEMEQLAFDERLLRIKQKSNEIDLLLTLQIYTLITGIYIAHLQYHRGNYTQEKLKQIHFKQRISFLLDHQSAMNYESDSRVIVQLQILECSVMLHAPRVFEQILENDGIRNVYESFSVVDNLKKIWNSVEGRGGKSGEFFYFTSDNKFVLKTITAEEFDFLIKNLEHFKDYYKHNPDSLLAKIYGIFTFRGNEIQRTFRLILMKNILGCQRSQVLRIYDMKGSKHDRQVIKSIHDLQDAHKNTLKDTDFANYQGKLHISSQQSSKLRESLRKDAFFLRSLNLIDYSLLIVRVNWKNEPKQANFWSNLQRIQRNQQDNQYYHIGVIDYMQKWDLQKKSEKWWKNFLGKKNVSAASPQIYQKRFESMVEEITSYLPPIVQLKSIYAREQEEQREEKFEQKKEMKELQTREQHIRQKNEYQIKVIQPNNQVQVVFKGKSLNKMQEKPLKITRDSSGLRLNNSHL